MARSHFGKGQKINSSWNIKLKFTRRVLEWVGRNKGDITGKGRGSETAGRAMVGLAVHKYITNIHSEPLLFSSENSVEINASYLL